MNLEYFETNLNKLGLDYKLHSGASELEIQDAQIRLEVSFPSKVYSFYKNINGLIVNEPKLEVYGLNNVKRFGSNVVFASFNGIHQIAMDVSKLNEAEQWNIINHNTGFIITLSMASFWSNKIWAWLRNNREVWEQEVYGT